MQTRDVIVVGAGVVGLTAAWRLALAGVDVRLLDPHPGGGASWAAAGMLAPVTELHYGEDALLQLNIASAARWDDHAAMLLAAGQDVGHERCGSVMVARDADDAAELRRLMAVQDRHGLPVTWLRGREVRAIEPGLAPSVRGAILVEGDHQVDNRALVTALHQLCRTHPRVLVEQVAVDRVLVDGGRTTGVALASGDVRTADVVVLAAGAGSAGLVPGVDLPAVRPVKGQLLHLRARDGAIATRTIRGQDCYIVSRPDGRIVVGATMEEQGADVAPTAGAVRDLLHAAWELLPGVAEAEFVEVAVGLRPATADNAPLLGPLDGVDGLLLAIGHHRNGVLQSALTAEAVVGWVCGTAVPDVVRSFSADRLIGMRA